MFREVLIHWIAARGFFSFMDRRLARNLECTSSFLGLSAGVHLQHCNSATNVRMFDSLLAISNCIMCCRDPLVSKCRSSCFKMWTLSEAIEIS
jgi:hypothetical protein